ncbi:hypothetical protein LOK49_LG04G00495 [Camellia lanceoleosa]|uniref:Uncharacterized protein n=1 Tax=Camellia lanceoleosa TaxID=1840588 RepID=A0ACC0I076_9ERIC|nr:hypothetical protein LOK49_LG04G00495 [Camellia lanceoleosa]
MNEFIQISEINSYCIKIMVDQIEIIIQFYQTHT